MRKTTFLLLFCCAVSIGISAQSGGSYHLEKTVITSSGGNSSGGSYSLESTYGQPIAGGPGVGSSKLAYYGFWTPHFAPTAALVEISGKVMMSNGRGIAKALVRITDVNGQERRTLTSAFGYYAFADIPAGESYIISVSAKRFSFIEPQRVIIVNDSMTDIDFLSNSP